MMLTIRKTIYLWLVVLALGFCTSHSSFANQVRAGVVPIFVQESLDASGRQKPLKPATEQLIKYLTQETGLQFVAQRVPWMRAKYMVQEGHGIIWGFSKSPDRTPIFRYSEPVLFTKIWAITHGDSALSIHSINDLRGKVVSVERGVSMGIEFENAKASIFKIDEDTASATSRFKKLVAGRCDALLWGFRQFDEKDMLERYLNTVYIPSLNEASLLGKNFRVSVRPIFVDSLHFASAKGYFEHEMQLIDQALRRASQNGELRAIQREFE